MDIGIIGAGNIGGTLTRLLTGQGHTVKVANSRSPETLAELAAETGATAVWASDAAEHADLVIVSIPQKNVVDLAPGIVQTAKPGAPVIETNNYYPQQRDGRIEAIEQGRQRARGYPNSSGSRFSRSSTASSGSTYSKMASRVAPSDGSRCPSQATTQRTSRLCSTLSTHSGSTQSTVARSLSPGANSPAHRCTARTLAPRRQLARSPRHLPNAPTPSARKTDRPTRERRRAGSTEQT